MLYFRVHDPKRDLELLQYMENIRIASGKLTDYGLKAYHGQFRVLISKYTTKNWSLIGHNVWLLCITPTNEQASQGPMRTK